MPLNESKGDMYDFVTHTWNTVKGECPHGCLYCYMHRWGKQRPVRFDRKELKTDLGDGNFIFVGSSCDLFADGIESDWIINTLNKCNGYDNKYLFQSKNPERMSIYLNDDWICHGVSVVCTTIETNRFYDQIMRKSPMPNQRAFYFGEYFKHLTRFVTIEPIMDFDLDPMVELIKRCEPVQVNIGADSGSNHLPEPSRYKILALIYELKKFTTIANKRNLDRILGKEKG